MTDEEILSALLHTATGDLRAPRVEHRFPPAVVPLHHRPAAATGRHGLRQVLVAGVAAVAGAAAVLVAVLGFGLGARSRVQEVPRSVHSGAGAPAAPAVSGPQVLYRLASTVRAQAAPTGRYVVQIERQSQGGKTYLKATIIDSRTGDTWTYQRGDGVPPVLPMARGFSPTEAELQATDPTNAARLRAVLISQASAAMSTSAVPQTPNDLAVTQAIDTLWNPLVQPSLRAALVSVIASSPGVTTDAHVTDARGRRAVEISYDDAALGQRLSVYLDPSNGTVLENSQQPYQGTAGPTQRGMDLYLSQYWTNTSPTVNPLNG